MDLIFRFFTSALAERKQFRNTLLQPAKLARRGVLGLGEAGEVRGVLWREAQGVATGLIALGALTRGPVPLGLAAPLWYIAGLQPRGGMCWFRGWGLIARGGCDCL
jgi:hypothetical protein